jgi:formylmethanofuran dehydrogenase subunit A
LFAIAYGTTIFGAKVFLKEQCGFMVILKKGKKDYRSTAELDTLEMTKFIEWIRNYSSIELGNYIPTPDEYIQNKFEIDSEIEKFKEYL